MSGHLAPIRERANELLADPAELDRLLALGADKAREIASATLADVYSKVGFLPYRGSASARESANSMCSAGQFNVKTDTRRVPVRTTPASWLSPAPIAVPVTPCASA